MPVVSLTLPKCTFLSIDYRESKYRQFATRRWRTRECMTEYMDELIQLFRKARPGSPAKTKRLKISYSLVYLTNSWK